eukprot:gene22071-29135_t
MESTCIPLDSLEFGFNSSTEMPPGNHNLVFCSNMEEGWTRALANKCTTIASGTFKELAPEHCSQPAPGVHNEQEKLTGSARHATEEPQRACDEYCCKEDDIKGCWAADGQLELASSAREMLGPDWWVLSNASSRPGPEDEKLLLDISFLWSPRYVNMIRTVKLLITEFSSVANAGGASDPVVMLVGAGLWHVSRWPQEPQEKGEFDFLTNLLSHELMLNVDNKHKVAWLRHLLLLDTPTGRFTREAQQPQIQQIQDRNYGLKTWADAAFRAPYVTLLPIDRMSRLPGAPTGLLGRDWHYSCDLERFGEVFKGNSSDFLAGCLVPDETGSCQDYMNFMLWQVAANILCNGAE